MKKVKFGSEHLPTPKKARRIGKALVSAGAVIAGYAATQNIEWVIYTGLAFSVVGSFISDLFYEEG